MDVWNLIVLAVVLWIYVPAQWWRMKERKRIEARLEVAHHKIVQRAVKAAFDAGWDEALVTLCSRFKEEFGEDWQGRSQPMSEEERRVFGLTVKKVADRD